MILALAASIALGQTTKPELKLAVGDAWSYERSVRYTNAQEDIDETHVDRFDFKVKSVGRSTYDVEVSTKLLKTIVDGLSFATGEETKPVTFIAKIDGSGINVPEDRREETDFRLDRLSFFLISSTSNVGRIALPQVGAGFPPLTIMTSPKAATTPKMAVGFSAEEQSGFSATGTAVLDGRSGLLIEAKIAAVRFRMPGGEHPATAEVTIKSVSRRIAAERPQ